MNQTKRARRRANALRPLLEDEGLTYTQAAARLGITRGAVAGLADRHGIKTASIFGSPSKEGINHMKTKPKRKPVTAFVPLAVDEPEAFTPKPGAWDALPGSTPKRMSNHHTGECLWAVAEDPFLFCCLPVAPGRPYCPAHFSLGNRPAVQGTPTRRAPRPLKGLTS